MLQVDWILSQYLQIINKNNSFVQVEAAILAIQFLPKIPDIIYIYI